MFLACVWHLLIADASHILKLVQQSADQVSHYLTHIFAASSSSGVILIERPIPVSECAGHCSYPLRPNAHTTFVFVKMRNGV